MSDHLLMFHLASVDKDLLESRLSDRGDFEQRSYLLHANRRLAVFNELNDHKVLPFYESRDEILKDLQFDENGNRRLVTKGAKISGQSVIRIDLPDNLRDAIDISSGGKDLDSET